MHSSEIRVEPTSSLVREHPIKIEGFDNQFSFDICRRDHVISPQNRIVPLQDYHSLRRAKNSRGSTTLDSFNYLDIDQPCYNRRKYEYEYEGKSPSNLNKEPNLFRAEYFDKNSYPQNQCIRKKMMSPDPTIQCYSRTIVAKEEDKRAKSVVTRNTCNYHISNPQREYISSFDRMCRRRAENPRENNFDYKNNVNPNQITANYL